MVHDTGRGSAEGPFDASAAGGSGHVTAEAAEGAYLNEHEPCFPDETFE